MSGIFPYHDADMASRPGKLADKLIFEEDIVERIRPFVLFINSHVLRSFSSLFMKKISNAFSMRPNTSTRYVSSNLPDR